jgi:hypothetical protein
MSNRFSDAFLDSVEQITLGMVRVVVTPVVLVLAVYEDVIRCQCKPSKEDDTLKS